VVLPFLLLLLLLLLLQAKTTSAHSGAPKTPFFLQKSEFCFVSPKEKKKAGNIFIFALSRKIRDTRQKHKRHKTATVRTFTEQNPDNPRKYEKSARRESV